MADGTVEVDRDEISEADIDGHHGSRAKNDAFPKLHPRSDQSPRMHERQELRASRQQGRGQLLLERGRTNAAEINRVGGRTMAGQGKHGREIAKRGERVGIVVEEAGEFPLAAACGMLAGPSVKFPTKATGTDDKEFLHGLCGRRASRSATVRQARTCAPVIVC